MAKKRSAKLFDFPGQISLFDYLERVSEETETYLEKGERLTTLARKKFERMMDKLRFTDLEKLVYSTKLPEIWFVEDLVDILAKSVIRPLLKNLTTLDENDLSYQILRSGIGFDITLTSPKGLEYFSAYKYLRTRHKKTDDQLVLTIKEAGWPAVTMFGYRCYSMAKGKRGGRNDLICDKGDSIAADIAIVLSWLLCLTLYNRALADDELTGDIADAITVAGLKNTELVKTVLRRSGLKGGWFDKDVPAFTPFQKFKTPKTEVLRMFEEQTGVKVEGRSRWADDLLPVINQHECSTGLKPRGYLLHPEIEWYLIAHDPRRAINMGLGKAGYNVFLSRFNEDISKEDEIPLPWVIPHPDGYASTILSAVLIVLWKKKGTVAKMVKYYDDLRSESKRAKVYQTKKNIPRKVLKSMEESTLNRHFGYVEFDESCDMDALTILAAEFEAFMKRRLSLLNIKDVSIRFRLLGNYKAAGLYFPEISCLCVDVRYPSSFVHELGHCIDYTMDRLSEKKKFSPVYKAYERAFLSEENLPPDTRLELYTTRSKFNIDYYLLPTEVFARCMEMYVTRILGEELSICKIEDEMGWAYPDDERMMQDLTEFFDGLFFSLNNNYDSFAAVA